MGTEIGLLNETEGWRTMGRLLERLRIDPYILSILGMVGLAALLPARGSGATVAGHATTVAVGLLFFLYGARLSPQTALEGAKNWRLHLVVFASTFVLFPALGLAMKLLRPEVLTPQLYTGVLFLCLLPSTVQSSIAFTSIAKGDVAAAICSASFSNLVGIILTPLMVAGLIHGAGGAGFSGRSVVKIVLELLAPFLAGQLLRRWIADWVIRHKKVLGFVDKGSILIVVYAAFSEGVVAGIWHQLSVARLFILIGVCAALLAVVLQITMFAARRLGFNREARITIVFCGSKKSLASGLPMATVLFAGGNVGLIVLPLMLFHQIQLITCAALARRWARTAPEPAPAVQTVA
jgi:sodium/bile acid cotransporter 7